MREQDLLAELEEDRIIGTTAPVVDLPADFPAMHSRFAPNVSASFAKAVESVVSNPSPEGNAKLRDEIRRKVLARIQTRPV